MLKKIFINFSLNKHNIFLKGSADFNHIHLPKNNKLAVVHGINILLIVLDKIYEKLGTFRLSSLEVRFFKPLLLSKQKKKLRLDIIYNKGNVVLYHKKERLILIRINNEQKILYEGHNLKNKIVPYKKINKNKIKNLYPNFFLFDKLNLSQDLMNLSRYLGTIYPGNNSLISEINLEVIEKSQKKINLNFLNYDERLNLSKISIKVGNLNAFVTSFHAPKLPTNYSLNDIKKNKKTKTYGMSQIALVIGGSSGIGEIVSKIILSNGGKVFMTYFKNNIGKKIKLENDNNKNFSFIKFNINRNKDYLKLKKIKNINTLYYFTSPNINNQFLDKTTFKIFFDFYVKKLEKIINFYYRFNKNFTLFYPSTTFLDQKFSHNNLDNYIKTKKIAESRIKKLCKKKKIKLCILRLPITDTNQNISYLPIVKKNKIDVAVDILSEMDLLIK